MNRKKKTQMKRKVLAVLLAAVMFGGSAAVVLPVVSSDSGIVANAAATYGGFQYEENNNGGITITKYTGNDSEVVILSEIDGKSVTSIGSNAFQSCFILLMISTMSSSSDCSFQISLKWKSRSQSSAFCFLSSVRSGSTASATVSLIFLLQMIFIAISCTEK